MISNRTLTDQSQPTSNEATLRKMWFLFSQWKIVAGLNGRYSVDRWSRNASELDSFSTREPMHRLIEKDVPKQSSGQIIKVGTHFETDINTFPIAKWTWWSVEDEVRCECEKDLGIGIERESMFYQFRQLGQRLALRSKDVDVHWSRNSYFICSTRWPILSI